MFYKVLIFIFLTVSLQALTLQKASKYSDENVTGWLMSEKLDGIRAYWDGKNLLSRQGKIINAPEWFTKKLPPFELDGELWTSRADFENIQSIVLEQTPSSRWNMVKYMIFEVPHAKGDFTKRVNFIKEYIAQNELKHVEMVEQKVCGSKEELNSFLDEIVSKGGEGVMVKDGSRDYFEGRSNFILKVKKADDAEAKIIGYKSGSGKLRGSMGSLQVRMENGVEFFLGSGFSDEMRRHPPKLGKTISFRYNGFTNSGKPKFATFMRVRED